MKKFLINQLEDAEHSVTQNIFSENMTASEQTVQRIESILEHLYGKTNTRLEINDLIDNAKMDVNDDFFNFIKELIEFYASLPLLETESTIEYPIIYKEKYTNKEIIAFLNSLYSREGIVTTFTSDNVRIFKPSFRRKLTLNTGECFVFNNLLRKKSYLILERKNTIADLIDSGARGIQVVRGNLDINTDLYTFFMKNRAIHESACIFDDYQARKLDLLQTDGMILDARQIKNYMLTLNDNFEDVKWDEMHYQAKARTIHFLNKVLGTLISFGLPINLFDVMKKGVYDENSQLHLENLNISEKDIMDLAKVKTKYLTDKKS